MGDGTGVKPIYETLMDSKGLPFLPPASDGLMRHISASEACGAPAVCFQRVERVAVILDTLGTTGHSGYPVVTPGDEGEQVIVGVILRDHLVRLLASGRAFQPTAYASEVGGGGGARLHGGAAVFWGCRAPAPDRPRRLLLQNRPLGRFCGFLPRPPQPRSNSPRSTPHLPPKHPFVSAPSC